MTLAELRARFRREENDAVAPYLWADESINAWINEAHDEACRRSLLLVDSTSPVSKISFLAGAVGVALNPAVIYVRRATLASSNRPMVPKVSRAMDEEVPGWEGSMASVPRVFVPDWQTNYLRFWPPAVAAGTLNMTVVRTAVEPMGDSDEPEIAPRYHAFLLDWVRYRAYNTQDSEVFNAKKADQAERDFAKQFGEASAANEHWALEQYYDIGHN